jgi:hypothetical protein
MPALDLLSQERLQEWKADICCRTVAGFETATGVLGRWISSADWSAVVFDPARHKLPHWEDSSGNTALTGGFEDPDAKSGASVKNQQIRVPHQSLPKHASG